MPSLKSILVIGLAMTFLPVVAHAQATSTPALKIAVVDIQAALLQIPAGRRAKQRLESLAAQKQREIDAKKEELRTKAEAFQQQERLLQPAVRRERLEEMQKMRFELQQMAFEAERELKQKELELLQPISEKLEETIKTVAQEMGYTIVLHKAGVAYNLPAVDITSVVVARYGN